MNKTFLCNAAAANWGKSTFIKQLDSLIMSNPKRFTHVYSGPGKVDIFKVYADLNRGHEIVITSAGDQPGSYNRLINYLNKHTNVGIVICASREKGSITWKRINNIANQHGFQLIAYSNFYNQKLVLNNLVSTLNIQLANSIYSQL